MVAPLSDLMKSFESIVNNESIDGNRYVYVKGGRAATETKFQHRFTLRSRKEKTAQRLLSSIQAHYSAKAGDAVKPLLEKFERGDHQIQVKDLRVILQAAQAQRLNAMRRSMGALNDDALAPVMETVANGRVVTAEAIGQVVRRQMGGDAGDAVMAGRRDVYLESLPGLLNEAEQTSATLESATPRARAALLDFCRCGEMTRTSLERAVKSHFDVSRPKVWTAVLDQLQRLPDHGISFQEAANAVKAAEVIVHRAGIEAFQRKIGSDPLVSRALGLEALWQEGAELKAEERERLTGLLPAACEAAASCLKLLATAKAQILEKKGAVPAAFEQEARTMLMDAMAQSASFKGKVEAFKAALLPRARRETDFDAAVDYEISRQQWAPEKQAVFREVMAYLKQVIPEKELFGDKGYARHLASDMNLVKYDELTEKSAYYKALSVAGTASSHWIEENLTRLSEAFSQGLVPVAKLCSLLYGDEALPPDATQNRETLQAAFFKRHAAMCRQMMDAMQEQDGGRMNLEIAGDDDLLAMHVGMMGFAGLKLQAALECLMNPRRGVEKKDLRALPALRLCSAASAEAEFVKDFGRQEPMGQGKVTVHQADGSASRFDNVSGLSEAEKVAMQQGAARMPRHEQAFAALKKLCGENERQYRLALMAMTASGPVKYIKALAGVVQGGELLRGEHSAMNYRLSKDSDGSLIVECRTPASEGAPRFEASVVIHPDGTAEYRDLRFSPPED